MGIPTLFAPLMTPPPTIHPSRRHCLAVSRDSDGDLYARHPLSLSTSSQGSLQAADIPSIRSAAFVSLTGRYTARLTFVDPIPPHHRALFEELQATRVARRVENVWADGPSGFGRPASHPGVVNLRVPPTTGLLGYLRPLHVDHLNALQGYVETGL